jgi:hypothetical protein
MILYHFTCFDYTESILSEGLTKGDVPTKPTGPLSETNAVWLTTDAEPQGHGLFKGGLLTEEERRAFFTMTGTMPPAGARFPNKLSVRIKVVIPSSDRRLVKWTTWGRKHCQPRTFEGLISKNGTRYKTWWLYFGVIKPDLFQAVDYIEKGNKEVQRSSLPDR